jgi:peptidoglycan/xylan/chitin deacetylase (PgdA/CDA1 family)
MSAHDIDILMYHSITEGTEPICIAPETFRRQMEMIDECGYRCVALSEVMADEPCGKSPAGKRIVLTFDDGYLDLATIALPELRARGWTATVFLPAGKIGSFADWSTGPRRPTRRLLSWPIVAELASERIEIGAHGICHVDLTTLPPPVASNEVVQARHYIEDRIGRAVINFASPYGRTNAAIRAEIRKHYRASVGTRLARARLGADLYELPRIDMWYFRDLVRWRSYLEGKARGYFLLRRVLRRMRALLHCLPHLTPVLGGYGELHRERL